MAIDHIKPPKLSEIILDYAEPLIKNADGISREKSAISFSLCCWNASILPLDEARKQIDPLLDDLADRDAAFKEDMLDIFEMMHARKHKLYAHDRRFVIDYSLTENEDGLYLQIASTPMGKKKQDFSSTPQALIANC